MARRQQGSTSGAHSQSENKELRLWLSSTIGDPYNLTHDVSLEAYYRVKKAVPPTQRVSPELHFYVPHPGSLFLQANGQHLGSVEYQVLSDGTREQCLTTPAARRI